MIRCGRRPMGGDVAGTGGFVRVEGGEGRKVVKRRRGDENKRRADSRTSERRCLLERAGGRHRRTGIVSKG